MAIWHFLEWAILSLDASKFSDKMLLSFLLQKYCRLLGDYQLKKVPDHKSRISLLLMNFINHNLGASVNKDISAKVSKISAIVKHKGK